MRAAAWFVAGFTVCAGLVALAVRLEKRLEELGL